ncbi:MAG: hypothetical protein AAFQ13_11485 [Pseudomonadota bacterium]
MNHPPAEFLEDRALRDAARAVLIADIEHARTSLSGKAVAARVAGTIGDGAKDAIDVAKTHAHDNRGILAGLMAVLALWFAREPLLEIFGRVAEPEDAQEPLSEDHSEAATAAGENEIETPQDAPETDGEEPLTTGESDD